MTTNRIALVAFATLSFCARSFADQFTGEVRIVPPTSGTELPNLFITNNGNPASGVEMNFDAANSRSESIINLHEGNWRWTNLHPQSTQASPQGWTTMDLSSKGKLTLSGLVWNADEEYYESRNIVLDPENGQGSIGGKQILTTYSALSSYAAPGGFAFGEGTYSYGNSQTVLGRWNAVLSTVVTPPASPPVFIVGGGTSALRSNALVLRANGDATFSGSVQAPSIMVAGRPVFTATATSGLTIGGSSAPGTESIAAGTSSSATGNFSLATGAYSTALGNYSVAMGYDADTGSAAIGAFSMGTTTRALGLHSIAMGIESGAYSEDSIAIGRNNNVSGVGSVAMGLYNNTSDNYGTAIGVSNGAAGVGIAIGGWNSASYFAAVSLGSGNVASGLGSVALGWQSEASGYNAMAIGGGCKAAGTSSLAMGCSWATGDYSSALGFMNRATGIHEFVVGTYNDPQNPAPTTRGDFDHLFVVGNGYFDGTEHRSNAFVVKRNGDVDATGVIRVRDAGDLSMGRFTQGARP